jgi:uncharacterized repeat protein (TIGR01451 family)/MYXO-CTERM domain-containing protein
VVDVNGGAVIPGDILEYTISGSNKGNDDAVNVVVTDVIDPGLEFVTGSLEIVEGGAVGLKTDAKGDDQADFDAATKIATWRVGTGATATLGGTVAINATIKVKFKAKVVLQKGTIKNVGKLTGEGASGGVSKTWESDSDPNKVGKQTTDITVNECDTNAQCPADKPHCDPITHVCTGCVDDKDCLLDPAKPACQPSGVCGECSAANRKKCEATAKPECNTDQGVCVFCLPSPNPAPACKTSVDGPMCISQPNKLFCGCQKDPDCGGPTSGKVCDAAVQKCIDGCRGKSGNGCPTDKACTSPDTTIGTCVIPGADAGPETGSGGKGGSAGSGGKGGSSGQGASAGEAGGGPVMSADGSKDEGGCACSTPGHRDLGTSGLALTMLGLGSAIARRRRKSGN